MTPGIATYCLISKTWLVVSPPRSSLARVFGLVARCDRLARHLFLAVDYMEMGLVVDGYCWFLGAM